MKIGKSFLTGTLGRGQLVIKFKIQKISYFALGTWILFTTIDARNETGLKSSNLSKLDCLISKANEKRSNKKRVSSVSNNYKIWRLGNSGFSFDQYCGLDQLNPMAIGEAQFHNKSELNEFAKKFLELLESNSRVLTPDERAASELGTLAERMRYASQCQKRFVSKEGFGPLGKVIKETLSKKSTKDLVYNNNSFGGACPGYHDMSLDQRKNIWVFVMMSMSHYESSCNDGVINQGPNGLAAGLLQLHSESEDRYVEWDPDSNCEKGSSQNAKKSLKCGLTMIGNQIYKGAQFFDDRSHWQVLRNSKKPGTQGFQIRYALSQITECKANPLSIEVDLKSKPTRKAENLKIKLIPQMEVARGL